MPNKSSYLIGITGGSASGKTKFLQQLIKNFKPESLCLISQDNYYFQRKLQPVDNENVENFDLPESIDAEAFTQDILKIKNGVGFSKEEYTFNNNSITPKIITFKPAPIIIVEGLFVMHFEKIRQLLDLKIFVDTRDSIRLKRRIIRDNTERGYNLSDVLYRYEKHVMPTFDKYLKPLRQEADIVIPNNSTFDKALEVFTGFIKNILRS